MVVSKGWGEWGQCRKAGCKSMLRCDQELLVCYMVQLGTIADESVSYFASIYLQRTV